MEDNVIKFSIAILPCLGMIFHFNKIDKKIHRNNILNYNLSLIAYADDTLMK